MLQSFRATRAPSARDSPIVGPTVANAYILAIGVVNDHTVDCFRYREITRERANEK